MDLAWKLLPLAALLLWAAAAPTTSALPHVHFPSNDESLSEGSGDAPTTLLQEEVLQPIKLFSDEVTSVEEEEEDSITIEEPQPVFSVLHERVNRTEEIPACLTNGLTRRTLVLGSNDAKDYVLTFNEEDSFVMAKVSHFHLSSDPTLPTPQFELRLEFRTDLPRGLLTFLRLESDLVAQRIHYYLFLHGGHLSARVFVAGKRYNVVSTAGGLHDGKYHSVKLSTFCTTDTVKLTVDDEELTLHVEGLGATLSGAAENTELHLPARLWVGGVSESSLAEEEPKVRVRNLRGCVRHVQLLQAADSAAHDEATMVEGSESDLLLPTVHRGVQSGLLCKDKCAEDPCPTGSRCINHFSHVQCDCTDIDVTHPSCSKQDFREHRIEGGKFLSHVTQSWDTFGHKKAHKISFFFKTSVPDSVLVFVRSLYPKESYYSLGLDTDGKLRSGGAPSNATVRITLDNETLDAVDGRLSDRVLTDDAWHHINVKMFNADNKINIDPVVFFGYAPDFNQSCLQPFYPGDVQCKSSKQSPASEVFYFDVQSDMCTSASYSGCGANSNSFSSLQECQKSCAVTGMPSYRPFVGVLKRVFVDGVNVLAQEGKSTKKCTKEEPGTLSFTTPRSHIVIPSNDAAGQRTNLSIKLQFRVPPEGHTTGVLAQGSVLIADTVDNWMVISNNKSHLTFLLGENLLSVSSSAAVNTQDWNEMSLRIKDVDVTLSLNGETKLGTSEVPFTLISGVILGGQRAALKSCIRSLEIDGTSYDLRYLLDKQHGVVFDNCMLEGPCDAPDACLNGGECSLSAESAVQCDCSSTQYHGNRCQFPRYARSCEDYARQGFSRPGDYLVDVDGPGPQQAVPVRCAFSARGAHTTVAHALPQQHRVRSKDIKKSYKLSVDYSGLTDADLVAIVESSTACQQNVTFDCVRSRLKLSSQTWFSSPRMKMNARFGSETGGICPCKAAEECVRDSVACNCDLNDGLRRRDTGLIRTKEQLPVTAVYFVVDPTALTAKSSTQLTLGDLQCFKEAEVEDAVSLLDSESFLEFSSRQTRENLRSIRFAFRTSAHVAVLLHKPSYHHLQADFRVILTSARSLEVQFRLRSEEQSIKFRSAFDLNAASWQYFSLNFSPEQIQITLNGIVKLLDLDDSFKILGGEFYFGGSPRDLHEPIFSAPKEPGLIGCLKDVTVNDEQISTQELLRYSPTTNYRLGCRLSCDPNPCQNGARCIEKPNGHFECECKNTFSEWGVKCEYNLNDDSITLLDTETEMRYKDEVKPASEDWNPLSQNLTIAFRTREIQGLLVFIIDHIQNLIQIHLAKPNEVTVLWNTGFTLRAMTVNTGDIRLNRGDLVQLYLKRERHATTLFVLTQGRYFSASLSVGVDLLEERQYQQFPFGSEVPHSDLTRYENSRTLQDSFLMVLLGGAETSRMHAKIPGFIGCLSGLKIGPHAIKLTDRSVWIWSHTNYELGCYAPCESSTPCRNKGVCLNVFDKKRKLLTECDCSETSYVGQQCDKEVAYRFSGEDYLAFQELFNVFSQSFTLDFAFALDGTQPSEEADVVRTLLLVRDSPDSVEELALARQYGQLTLGIRQSGAALTAVVQWPHSDHSPDGQILEFDVSDFELSDGFRHHIKAILKDRTLDIQLDGVRLAAKSSDPLATKTDPALEALVVGSGGDHPVQTDAPWAQFVGCISNIQLRTADKKIYRPLHDYSNHANDTSMFTRVGLPHRTLCSEFRPAEVPEPASIEFVQMRLLTSEVKTENFQPLQQEEPPFNDKSGIKTAGKIGGVIVGGVALGVFIYLCKITHGEPKTVTNEIGLVQTAQKSSKSDPENPRPTAATSKESEPLLKDSIEMKKLESTSSKIRHENDRKQMASPKVVAVSAPKSEECKEVAPSKEETDAASEPESSPQATPVEAATEEAHADKEEFPQKNHEDDQGQNEEEVTPFESVPQETAKSPSTEELAVEDDASAAQSTEDEDAREAQQGSEASDGNFENEDDGSAEDYNADAPTQKKSKKKSKK
ncbi:uncharacterized protein LOC108679669 isoform X2 [Hyalella azteca]|uniref:Uncharacterized protein LOC108679669 isoform X2 n=1 Tax=Hyalella azteca TaxID=294128 RepID=A0A8B7PE02_HYAAZ|nr:uncharacterized protein LOC108679669 isoform X2 [Hyalella azteca]